MLPWLLQTGLEPQLRLLEAEVVPEPGTEAAEVAELLVVGEIRTEDGAVVSLSLVTITARHIQESEVIMP